MAWRRARASLQVKLKDLVAFRPAPVREEGVPIVEGGSAMLRDQTPVVCETPTPGRQSTRIARWKYELVRRAILEAIPDGDGGVAFQDLPGEVARRLSDGDRSDLGSVSWYTTVVKLDLEVRGELRRLTGSPQRLVRA